MSTSPTVPMLNAQGEAYDIPLSQMPDAARSGLEMAVDVKHAGTGERYTIPSSRYKEALANGMVPDSKSSIPVPDGLQSQPDTRNAVQRFLDDRLSTPQSGPAALDQFGRGAASAIVSPLAHPLQTLQGLAQAATPDRGAAGLAEGLVGGPAGAFVAHQVRDLAQDAVSSGPAHAAGLVAGGVVGGRLLGALPEVPGGIAGGVGDVMERARGYTSPAIDPQLQAASRVATAIRPQTGIGPDFETNLKTQLPAIMDYANRTANPMHSQWEAGTAARGLAEEGLNHYNTNILGPHADAAIPMDGVPEYQGKLDSEGRASLQDVNDRIGSINDYIRAAQRNAKTGGQQMSASEKLGLDTEASKLRNMLYNELGQRTGIDPGDIQSLRSNYGQQFSLADTIDAARRSRLGQIGAADEAGSGIALNKAGLLEKALTRVRGGQQYLADANFRDAVGQFQPSPTNYPQPVAPDPQMAVVNRMLAQQEFMHQNALSQAAQDAAAQRSTATTAYRAESKKSFGESMRARSAALRGGLSGN
jgi:hypothetical protein